MKFPTRQRSCGLRRGKKEVIDRQTSAYLPPRPNMVFKFRTRLPQLLPTPSSSIRLLQSVCPVAIRICCVYGAMVALSGLVWSIARPSGIEGVAVHSQVGSGHVGIVGKGGCDEDDTKRRDFKKILVVGN